MKNEANKLAMAALRNFRDHSSEEFKPFIRYSEDLNCVAILIHNCSAYEKKVTPEVSVLIGNKKGNHVGIIWWEVGKSTAAGYLLPKKKEKFLDMLQILVYDHRDVQNFITELGGRMDLCVEPVL